MPRVPLLPYCILVSICFSGLLWTFVSAASDQYGHNPQHEFGNTLGGESAPLIPFWTLEGDAFARQEFIRVVPDRQSKRGGIWNTEPNRFKNWEAIFKFRIHGVSRLGADGMVFWYTQEHSLSGKDNNFFGFTDTFTGLGLAIDTYDNDNTGKHPLIVAIINDGTKKYSHAHDEEGDDDKEEEKMEVGNCHVAVRNSPPWYIKVSYQDRQLVVQTSGDSQDWSPCLVASNIDLPTGYHFGFTAATGELADNHDLYGFAIKNLDNGAGNIDNKRVYASYDRYTVTDYLSKIAFQVNALANQVPENAGEAGNGVRSQKASGEGAASSSALTAVNNNILAIQGTLQELTRDIATVSSTLRDAQAAGQPVPGDAAGNSAIQSKLSALERKLDSTQAILNSIEMNIAKQVTAGSPIPTPNTIRQQRDKNEGPIPGFPVSKSWIPSLGTIIGAIVVVVIVVVVVCVVAVVILKARAERRKKFW